MNTGNVIKIFDAGRLKVTRAMPEKHINNFFGLRSVYSLSFLLNSFVIHVDIQ